MSLIRNDKNSRTMVFIDLRNILKASMNDNDVPCKVDFVKMTEMLVNGRNLIGAYVFDGVGNEWNDKDTRGFHMKLEFDGFRVMTRNSFDIDTREQKEVDVSMACEMLYHAFNDNYDVAIVVSGDRDFVPAIEHVQRCGKVVEVASFDSSFSKYIRRAADVEHSLNSLPILCLEDLEAAVVDEVTIQETGTEFVSSEGE